MSFSLHYNPLLLLLCAMLAAGIAWWIYRRTVPDLSPGRRRLLGSLRFLSFFVILFLLFEPILRRLAIEQERPVVAVLYDNSASIPLSAAPSDSIGVQAPEIRLADDVGMRKFAFASRVSTLPGQWHPSENPLTFDGERTDISAAIAHVREELRTDHLSGIILVSDGRYNAGRNPLYVAERSSVPIHTIVIGDTTARRDVVIGRVSANRVAYAGVEQPVEIEVRAEGYEGAHVTVSLVDGGRRVASESVELRATTVQVPVSLSYVPEGQGLRLLQVSVTELEGEVTHDNNHATLPVRVLDQKRRLLVLGASPDPDVAAVRQILQDDDNLELVVRIQKSRNEFYEGALPDDLSAFGAIVLAGYPGSAADRRVLSRIRAAVEQGTPVVFLFARQTDLALLGELDDVLPVRVQTGRPGLVEASLLVTADGLQHPIITGAGATAADWLRLPPLLASESRWTASPDARILARVQIRGVALDDPLVVIRARAGTRTVAILGANTWRWRNVPDDLRDFEHLWPALLSYSIQWVTAAQDQRPVRVRPVREVFAGDEPVEFLGEVYDERLQPVHDAVVDVEVAAGDGRRYPLRMRPAGHGRYLIEGAELAEGTYEYRAVARLDGTEIGEDGGTFVVGGLAIEQRETRADPHLMRQIAERSGGIFLTGEEADQLPLLLLSREELVPRTATVGRDFNLWRHPFFLILIIALLSTEWVLRKRSGLV